MKRHNQPHRKRARRQRALNEVNNRLRVYQQLGDKEAEGRALMEQQTLHDRLNTGEYERPYYPGTGHLMPLAHDE